MSTIPGIKALYHFNGNALDASGNGNDATVVGATFNSIDQKLGSACASLDGINDVFILPNQSSFNFLTAANPTFAMAEWIKTSDTSSELITKADQSFPHGCEFRVRNGRIDVVLATNGSNFIALRGNTFIADNIYHLVIWSVLNGVSTIYVDNGVQTITDNSTGVYTGGANTKEVLIGARWNGTNKEMWYGGLKDEGFISNIDATAADVNFLWNDGFGRELLIGGGRRRRMLVGRS